MDKALKTVEKILAVNRNPQLAEEVDHDYQNKFELADRMTNIAIVAQMDCLQRLGLDFETLQKVDQSKSTTLRFQASEKCTFLKDQIVEVPMGVSHETTTESQTTTGASNFFGTTKKTVQRLVKKVKEYHWTIDVQWEVSVVSGTDEDNRAITQHRSSSMIVITQSKFAPIEASRVHEPVDLSLTWFLQQMDVENYTAQFHIRKESAKTPRRNDQVEEAMAFFNGLKAWAANLRAYFEVKLQHDIVERNNPVVLDPLHKSPKIKSCTSLGVFIPILPLMEEHSTTEEEAVTSKQSTDGAPLTVKRLVLPRLTEEAAKGPGLSGDDCTKLLAEHVVSLETKIHDLQKTFPSAHLMKLFSVAEAALVVLCEHIGHLSKQYEETIQYLEKMLENQLIKAIGKRVTMEDLEQFVRYHNARFLNPSPRPFCHAIGRPNHYPFGVLSIESANGNGGDFKPQPIETLMREVNGMKSLKVPLTAATTVELTGNTFLHGWMNHRSQESSHKAYQLIARARQFSSFLLIIGTMMGPEELDPKDAIIIQNKDEVLIPLLLNELPSAKEFKDAIQSLSPEQRSFAESFRSMQLGSSVFGVSVIQIKPQLEALLGLPEDSLAKEIKLTQDLMKLFIEYQVPSDLLSYDGPGSTNITMKEKVENVKGHVDAVLEVIDSAKEQQLEEATMKADMAAEAAKTNNPNFRSSIFDHDEATRSVNSSSFGGLAIPSGEAAAFGAMSTRFGAAPAAPPSLPVYHDLCSVVASSSSLPVGGGGATPQTPSPEAAPGATFQKMPADDGATTSHNVHPYTSSVRVNDFTAMPKALDASIEKYDTDSALRSTIIKTSRGWSRCRQAGLLTKAVTSRLGESEVKSEKSKAFDLMDALSRSGSLPISYSDLHVLICVTHCFEKDVMGTVVQDNINPIERLELSTLLLCSTIHGKKPGELIATEAELHRVESRFPALLEQTL